MREDKELSRRNLESQLQDFIKNGGEKGSKEAGKLRSEGKEYIVQEGDILHFLFNVN